MINELKEKFNAQRESKEPETIKLPTENSVPVEKQKASSIRNEKVFLQAPGLVILFLQF